MPPPAERICAYSIQAAKEIEGLNQKNLCDHGAVRAIFHGNDPADMSGIYGPDCSL